MDFLLTLAQIASVALELFSEFWYWLIMGIVLTSLLRTLLPIKNITTFLNRKRRQIPLIPVAAATGALSPVRACCIGPLFLTVLAAGVPLAIVMAFIMTSALFSPLSFVMTIGILGVDIAFARMVASVTVGIGSGLTIACLTKIGFLENQVRLPPIKQINANPNNATLSHQISEVKGQMRSKMLVFLRDTKNVAFYNGKYFVVAIILGSITHVLLPKQSIIDVLGPTQPFSILVSVALSIPLFLQVLEGFRC